MNITITFKNFEPSEHLKGYIRRRFEKLGRFLPKTGTHDISINLSVDKIRHIVDVQITGDSLTISATEHSNDMYASVDIVLDKVEAQCKKYSEKLKGKRREIRQGGDSAPESLTETLQERMIVETNDFYPKPLHLDEAALQLEEREKDLFLVFLRAETQKVAVIYRRNNGDFGLIEQQ